jgi:hypothetical protein
MGASVDQDNFEKIQGVGATLCVRMSSASTEKDQCAFGLAAGVADTLRNIRSPISTDWQGLASCKKEAQKPARLRGAQGILVGKYWLR